jgi:hypothetical protein
MGKSRGSSGPGREMNEVLRLVEGHQANNGRRNNV